MAQSWPASHSAQDRTKWNKIVKEASHQTSVETKVDADDDEVMRHRSLLRLVISCEKRLATMFRYTIRTPCPSRDVVRKTFQTILRIRRTFIEHIASSRNQTHSLQVSQSHRWSVSHTVTYSHN